VGVRSIELKGGGMRINVKKGEKTSIRRKGGGPAVTRRQEEIRVPQRETKDN